MAFLLAFCVDIFWGVMGTVCMGHDTTDVSAPTKYYT